MIKSRIAQVIYLTAFCVLGLIGVLASTGLFEAEYAGGFYVYFTNLSNYFCFGFMIAELVFVVKKLKAQEDGTIDVSPLYKFMGMVMIIVTFAIYNFVLAKDRSAAQNLSIRSVLLHIVLPVMFVLDWVLFYKKKQFKWFYPLITLAAPAIYAAFVFIRAWIYGGKGVNIYPYFFLNPEIVGIGGLFMWLGILLAVFTSLGFIIYGLDKIHKKKTNQDK